MVENGGEEISVVIRPCCLAGSPPRKYNAVQEIQKCMNSERWKYKRKRQKCRKTARQQIAYQWLAGCRLRKLNAVQVYYTIVEN